MGSMRNPVGPLPSSIYWRRRAVAATLVALLALLVVWIVTSGGGGKHPKSTAKGSSPAKSITPGPSQTGPAISQAPGGRGESSSSGGSDPGGSGGSGDADSGSGGGGTGTGGSGDDAGGDPNGTGGSAGSGAAGGGGTAGQQVPASSGLPDCTAGAVQLTVRTTRNSYAPGEKPKFDLVAKNTSAADCKVDFGPKGTVFTITSTENDGVVWSSKDCPTDARSLFIQVPADSTITHTVEWDRKKSAPKCEKPGPAVAGPGTYLVEAKAPGMPVKQTSVVLAKD
ncbi:hypothetical protein OG282_13950 [Streptomyces sp. NBC_01014]|nr:hypothetical protein OG282_13950 [Streptomyces sp. NBC_01014]